MTNSIIPIGEPENSLASSEQLARAGQAANAYAAKSKFADYRERKAAQTLRRQDTDLENFKTFLAEIHTTPGDLAHDPQAWRGITWGLVESYKRWMLAAGYAVSTVNFRLSTVKVYAELAMLAGALTTEGNALIRAVKGYAHKEIANIDRTRTDAGKPTRKGSKKAEAVSITPSQARQLKQQPDTPQGRRDAALMAILLDHGLRCGEVALLRVEDVDLDAEIMIFRRPKVQKIQTHKLTKSALVSLRSYLENDHPTKSGALLLASSKGGKLAAQGMSARAITKRVEYLGARAGLVGLSAHDCRHYWATQAARHGTPIERLKDAGGWSSLAMPGRYIEAAHHANEGVDLGSD